MENPTLTEENLIKALLTLTNNNGRHQQIKEAEEALLHWEEIDPTCYVLKLLYVIQSILSSSSSTSTTDRNNNYYLTLSSILSLKVAIKRHWKLNINKKTKRLIIDESTKESIRHFAIEMILLDNTNSNSNSISNSDIGTNKKIQENIISLLCVIVRMDIPLQSKDIIPTLITRGLVIPQNTTSSSFYTIRLHNAAIAIDTLLIELRNKRLSMDKKYVQMVVLSHTTQISAIYQLCLSKITTMMNDEKEMDLLIHIIKIMNHCLSTTLPELVLSYKNDIDTILSLTLRDCNRATAIRFMSQESNIVMEELEQLIVDTQSNHPMHFVQYLSKYLEYFYSVLLLQLNDNNNNSLSSSNKSLSLSLQFLGNVITSCSKYSSHVDICNIISLFFSKEIDEKLFQIILKCIKITTMESIEEWKDDSETYYYDTYVNDDTISANAQVLYLSMIESTNIMNGSLLHNRVLSHITLLLSNIDSQLDAFSLSCNTYDIITNTETFYNTICQWDAVYTTLGISVNSIVQHFDLNSWFYSCIVQGFTRLTANANNNKNNFFPPILHFRIVWLIGCIAHILSYDNYIHSLHILSSTLTINRNNNDTTTTLSSTTSMQQDDNDDPMLKLGTIDSLISLFSESEHTYIINYTTIQPYYSNIIGTCMLALQHTNYLIQYESKSKIKELILLLFKLDTISSQYLSSYDIVKGLIHILSTIWQRQQEENDDDDNNLIRKDVLIILSHIISNIKNDDDDSYDNNNIMIELHSIIVPLIDNVFTEIITTNTTSSLENDAISLIWTLMKCSSSSSNKTIPMLYPLYNKLNYFINKDDYTYLIPIMRITHGFIVLGETNDFSFIVSQQQQQTLGDILKKCLGYVSIKGASYVHLVFEALLIICCSSNNNNTRDIICQWLVTTSGFIPSMLYSCGMRYFKHKQCESDIVIVQYLTTISRILLSYPTALDSLFPLSINDVDGNSNNNIFLQEDLFKMYYNMFHLLSHDESVSFNNSGGYGLLRRKIWIMLFISFLPTRNTTATSHHPVCSPFVMKSLDELLLLCVDVFKNDSNKEIIPFEIMNDNDYDDEFADDVGNEESNNKYNTKIRSELISKDSLVYNTDLKTYLKLKLQDCATYLGNENYNEMISAVEPVTLQQLERLLS